MSETENQALNGDNETGEDDHGDAEVKEEVQPDVKNDEEAIGEGDLKNGGDEDPEKASEDQPMADEPDALPIVIDDLAELNVEWMMTKTEEGIGNWGKEYATSEVLENIDDGQLDIEPPPPMPEVKISSHGQTMHLVPLRDDGRTSTTLTWIRKTALRKDSASDRRITIRGLGLGDLFHPRIYTLIQLGHSVDYSSTDRTMANTCASGVLTINFRTIMDRLVALRRYLLDIEIPGRRLEVVCTFPDHKRPPDFETLWQAYAMEGVPPCASQRADREILARQIAVKNIPAGYEEEQVRKYFGSLCDEIEFMDDYENQRCAIVTFLDVVSCHIAHARQSEIVFEDGTRPQVYLMTDMIANSKLMPRKAKDETDEERQLRHTFELLWNHQQKMANVMHSHDRYGNRVANDFHSRRTLQAITRKLPNEIRQRIEDRAQERQAKETEEKELEKATLAIQQKALKDQEAVAVAEQEPKNGLDEAPPKTATGDNGAQKRPADASPAGSQQSLKRARRKNFRGGGVGANAGIQRRAMIGGGNRRDVMPYQRERGPMHMSHRGGPTSPRPMLSPNAGRYGGGGYMGEVRASPWIVPPGAGASNFDRHMDAPGAYGSPAFMARREMPPVEHGAPLFGGPGGMAYGGQGSGYMARDMEMRRGAGGGGELYQRRDAMGAEYQRTDYRGFYGKH